MIDRTKTEGLPLHEWAQNFTPAELAKIDWLKDLAESAPLEELIMVNSTITTIEELIKKIQGRQNPDEKSITNFKSAELREKIFALIKISEKEETRKQTA